MKMLDFLARTGYANLHPDGFLGTRVLLNQIPPQTSKILEIGCGTGNTAIFLSQYDYHGLDISPLMISAANRRKKKFNMRHANFNVYSGVLIDLPDNSIDCIFSESVLSILSEEVMTHLGKEISRVLKPGGVLMFNEAIWRPSTTKQSARLINKQVVKKLGIIQASEFLHDKDDWQSFFSHLNFEVSLLNIKSQTPKKIDQTLQLKTERYNKRTKVRNLLNPLNLLQYFYFKILDEKMVSHNSSLEYWLFKCTLKTTSKKL